MSAFLINQRFIIAAIHAKQASDFFLEQCQQPEAEPIPVYSLRPLDGGELVPMPDGTAQPLSNLTTHHDHMPHLIAELPEPDTDLEAILPQLNTDPTSPIVWASDAILRVIHGHLRGHEDATLFFIVPNALDDEKQLYGAFISGDEEAERIYSTYPEIRDAAERHLRTWVHMLSTPALVTWAGTQPPDMEEIALRKEFAAAPEVKDLLHLERIDTVTWLYLIETIHEFPRFVVGRYDNRINQAVYIHRCGKKSTALDQWPKFLAKERLNSTGTTTPPKRRLAPSN